jgi:hypothetical protein
MQHPIRQYCRSREQQAYCLVARELGALRLAAGLAILPD